VIVIGESKVDSEFNQFIKETTDDIENLRFNTAISKMMVFINAVYKEKEISKDQARDVIILLSLFAPHIAEELLSKLGEQEVSKHQ